MKFIVLALLVLIFPAAVYSNQSHHRFTFENDVLNFQCSGDNGDGSFSLPLICENEDAWFTNGFLYEFRSKGASQGSARQFNFSLGHKIYTPAHIEDSAVIENDRPYAGWLFGSFFKEMVSGSIYEKREWVVGVLGRYSGAEELYNGFHRYVYGNDRRDARGWQHQIGSELGIRGLYERRSLIFRSSNARFDLNWLAMGRFGNVHIDGTLGGMSRFGLVNPLPPSFDPYFNQNALFGVFQAEVRLVVYDATFQGGGFDRIFNNNQASPHHFEYGDLKPLVVTMVTGLHLKTAFGLSFSYLVLVRTREFVDQTDNFRYGRITVSISY